MSKPYRLVDSFFRKSRVEYLALHTQPERRRVVLAFIDDTLTFVDALIALTDSPSKENARRTDIAYQRFGASALQFKRTIDGQMKPAIADQRVFQGSELVIVSLSEGAQASLEIMDGLQNKKISSAEAKMRLKTKEKARNLSLSIQVLELCDDPRKASPEARAVISSLFSLLKTSKAVNANLIKFADTRNRDDLAAVTRLADQEQGELKEFQKSADHLWGNIRASAIRNTASN